MLQILDVPKCTLYRTHDLRRGHARDLQASGCSLYELLSAGEWRGPAFMEYLDRQELENAAVDEVHFDELSDWSDEEVSPL